MGNNLQRACIPVEVRREVRGRAKGYCQDCGRPLSIRREIPRRKEVRVEVWQRHACWKCNRFTPVLRVSDDLECGVGYLQRRDVGEPVRARFPWFRPGYSQTMGMKYYGNHCQWCGALQGEHYVILWTTEQATEGRLPSRVERIQYSGQLLSADIHDTVEDLPFHIHHVNLNPGDNSSENLRVLCPECHRRIHAKEATTC
jgi:5-methylcytosine-specific restriction endonuclease McrA